MVSGRDKKDWGLLSVVCATLYNASGNFKKMASPDDFNPYATAANASTKVTKSIPLKMFAKHVCKCSVCGRFGSKCICEGKRSDG